LKEKIFMFNPKYERSLIILLGQEGVGKTTMTSRLSSYIPYSAQIDAENVGQVNPWEHNEKFLQLLWKNIIDVTNNFWSHGFKTVIAGSFFDYYSEYQQFRNLLPEDINVCVIHLCASKPVRDQRRRERVKAYNKEESDWIDENYPEDDEFGKHKDALDYLRIDTSNLSIDETIAAILNYLKSLGVNVEQS
jgi:adenylylsulfate kinase-like enzyme